MKNFVVEIRNDHDEASVLLAVSRLSPLGPGAATVALNPREARRIAMDLLKAAEDAEDQAAQNARRAAASA